MGNFLSFFLYICTVKQNTSMKLAFAAIILVAVAFVLLGVKVLFVKGGRFPSGHVHDSEALRSRGIKCAHSRDDGSDDVTRPI